jgi:hypothetical protein
MDSIKNSVYASIEPLTSNIATNLHLVTFLRRRSILSISPWVARLCLIVEEKSTSPVLLLSNLLPGSSASLRLILFKTLLLSLRKETVGTGSSLLAKTSRGL